MQMMAVIHMSAADYDAAEEALLKVAPVFRQLGDRKGEVGCFFLIAQALELKVAASGLHPGSNKFRAICVRAVKAAQDAAILAAKVAEQPLVGAVQSMLSRVLHMASKGGDAVKAAKVAVGAFREAGDRRGEAHALLLQAAAAGASGQEPEARDSASKALLMFRQLGDKSGEQLAERAIDSLDALQELSRVAAAAPQQQQQQQAKPLPELVSAAAVEASLVEVAQLSGKVRSTVAEIVGVDDLDNDTPLMQAGLTSQSAVLLRNALQKDMGVASLPFTMMFDFPSVSALTDYFVQRL